MMKSLFTTCLLLQCMSAWAVDCPVTIASHGPFVAGWPEAKTWHGSEKLAVILAADGTWPTTRPGHSISMKVFWYADGFQPGMEDEFTYSIQRLGPGPDDVETDPATSAGGPNLGAWTILIGIDFPSEGCWRISGSFRGESLAFIVRTEVPAYRRGGTTPRS